MITYEERVVGIQSHAYCLPHFNGLCEGIFKAAEFWKGRPNMVFPTIKWHGIPLFLSLFARMYVCISQKYSVSKAFFSLLVCMYWPSRTSTPSQSEIFCLIAWTPLAFPLFVQAQREYVTLGGCAGLGRPIHTYEQREKGLGDRIFLANTDIHRSKERISKPQIYYYLLPRISLELWSYPVWQYLVQQKSAVH